MPKVTSVAAMAGQIVSAERDAFMCSAVASAFAPLHRALFDAIADLCRPTVAEAFASLAALPIAEPTGPDAIGPHHHVKENELCRN